MIVFSLRDLSKYLFKISILIIALFIFFKFIGSSKDKGIEIPTIVDNEKLVSCLDENIPGIKQVNNNEDDDIIKDSDIEPIKLVLGMEIASINTLKLKDSGQEVYENEYNEEEVKVEKAQIGLTTKVIENNVPTKYTNSYNGVQVRNETQINLTEDMLKPDININCENVLIFHTHTCESYTATENYNYVQTGTYRTTDLNYTVARVGDELENQLKSYKYNVIHDKTYHDYPAYNGSYGRSLETVENLLNLNPNTDVVIDLHRDAIGDYSYAPTVMIGEEYAAQLMFVIGTDGGGLEHPNWDQNLKFAIKVQEKANELYPGLFKPIILRNSRYNQHLSSAAVIIEVGATGNTLEQTMTSMKYLARVMSEVVK